MGTVENRKVAVRHISSKQNTCEKSVNTINKSFVECVLEISNKVA